MSNLASRQSVEPGNAKVPRLDAARAAREERTDGWLAARRRIRHNPFMRCKSAELRRSMKLDEAASDIDVPPPSAARKTPSAPPRPEWEENKSYLAASLLIFTLSGIVKRGRSVFEAAEAIDFHDDDVARASATDS